MTVKIEDLKNGDSFKSDLLLDKKFLILPKTAEMPEEFIKALKNWDFREINGTIGVYREASLLHDDLLGL